jgi:hypothetical protein
LIQTKNGQHGSGGDEAKHPADDKRKGEARSQKRDGRGQAEQPKVG